MRAPLRTCAWSVPCALLSTLILTAPGAVVASDAALEVHRAAQVTERWEPVPPTVTPGDDDAPPSDAIVLFDGSDLDVWEAVGGGPAGWQVAEGAMTVSPGTGDIRTRVDFEDVQLHVEWRTPAKIEGEGQGRGNSGVFLMERYEVQVLDSYQNPTYANGQAASIYKQHIPLVNASRPPGEWQSYDILFTAPRFNDAGRMVSPAQVTVLHNGVLVQHGAVLQGETEYVGAPGYKAHGPAPVRLQDHSNPVSYRNIWVRRL